MEERAWYEDLREITKERYKARVAKTFDRVSYAVSQFKKHNVEYSLKNEDTGHFHCWRKIDNKLFQFYAGTGKIQGLEDARGISALIKILTGRDCFEN
jgi:hypothetical protein